MAATTWRRILPGIIPRRTSSTSARLSTLTYLHNPLEAIIDAVDKIINGDIVHYVYDVAAQRLVRRD